MLTKFSNLFQNQNKAQNKQCAANTKEMAAILEDNLEALQENKSKLQEAKFAKGTIIDRTRQKRATQEWLKGNARESKQPLDQEEIRVRLSNSGNYEIHDPMPDMDEAFLAFSKDADPFFDNDRSLEMRMSGAGCSTSFSSWISGNQLEGHYEVDRDGVLDHYLDENGLSSKTFNFEVVAEAEETSEASPVDISVASCNKRYLNDLIDTLEQRVSENQNRTAYWTDSTS